MGKASRTKAALKQATQEQQSELQQFRADVKEICDVDLSWLNDDELALFVYALHQCSDHMNTTANDVLMQNVGAIKTHGLATFYHNLLNTADHYVQIEQVAQIEREQQRTAQASPTIALPNGSMHVVRSKN